MWNNATFCLTLIDGRSHWNDEVGCNSRLLAHPKFLQAVPCCRIGSAVNARFDKFETEKEKSMKDRDPVSLPIRAKTVWTTVMV